MVGIGEELGIILTSELFVGIMVGAALSLFGGWGLARFTVSLNQKQQSRLARQLSIDVIKNIQSVISEMEVFRDRTQLIYGDFLEVLQAEVSIWGRTREHLVVISDEERSELRRLMINIELKRIEAAQYLANYYRACRERDDYLSQSAMPEAEDRQKEANNYLTHAQASVARLAQLSSDGSAVISLIAKNL